MVCLNLVHNKDEEEFSLLEMTAAFISFYFWSVIISENFKFKMSWMFFLKMTTMKARISLHFSVLSCVFNLFSLCFIVEILSRRLLLELLYVCVTHGPSFKVVLSYILRWSGFRGKPRLSSLTWCPGGPQSQIMLFPQTPWWERKNTRCCDNDGLMV